MTYYTIKLDDAVQLTGNIVTLKPTNPPKPKLLNSSEEYSCFEISGDLIVEGNIVGIGSLTSIVSSDSAPPFTEDPNIKGMIVYSNDFLYLCVDDSKKWIRWPVSLV